MATENIELKLNKPESKVKAMSDKELLQEAQEVISARIEQFHPANAWQASEDDWQKFIKAEGKYREELSNRGILLHEDGSIKLDNRGN